MAASLTNGRDPFSPVLGLRNFVIIQVKTDFNFPEVTCLKDFLNYLIIQNIKWILKCKFSWRRLN